MGRIVVAVAAVLAAAVTSDLSSTAGAEPAASRIVDRTLSCSVALFADGGCVGE